MTEEGQDVVEFCEELGFTRDVLLPNSTTISVRVDPDEFLEKEGVSDTEWRYHERACADVTEFFWNVGYMDPFEEIAEQSEWEITRVGLIPDSGMEIRLVKSC